MIEESVAPDGRPTVQPLTRADWRAWLLEHHATSTGVWLVGYRRGSGKPRLEYEDAIEELLCVGWIDSTGGYLDDERTRLWVCPRRPRSVWSRSNRDRVERLTSAGLMLPAGLAAVDEAKRRGMWTALDAVEDLSVPDDLAAALAANPPARETWDRAAPSMRRMILWWILSAKRPETRAGRIADTARRARDGEPLDRTRRVT
jgi:uncharacterized protein YdeI (YjbR/CyaY-like superfamily)